ncbi:damage-inducible protein DinB [Virgibacillus phasianinus]|uniref:Damage-inducible protein DinB n=1 Tax=Virgibacillus phasianinus TaxID=2017483 RepID=A0A220TY39_9BACI|nr:DinB family protein [Virgibacillus phasianinus]ASK60768.1 damage-inducible protein DinB [Virgibacillus phasianinus]
MNVLVNQYDLIRLTREKLFQYCETLSIEDYTHEHDNFGWGSIRNLHVHVAECYQSWLANFGLKKGLTLVTPELVRDVQDMRRIFEKVDKLVYEFLEKFDGQWDLGITGPVSWQDEEEELTTLWLYTHVITHEFHHKGQIVSMSRQLGYTPDDTDLIEPGHL